MTVCPSGSSVNTEKLDPNDIKVDRSGNVLKKHWNNLKLWCTEPFAQWDASGQGSEAEFEDGIRQFEKPIAAFYRPRQKNDAFAKCPVGREVVVTYAHLPRASPPCMSI